MQLHTTVSGMFQFVATVFQPLWRAYLQLYFSKRVVLFIPLTVLN